MRVENVYICDENESVEPSKEIDIDKKLYAKILVVEDNITNQMLMEIVLGDIGIDMDLAKNGLEAIELFKVNRYDLILMDENMPKMKGSEATKIILEIEEEEDLQHTPIVALSADAFDRDKFLKAGMDEYISKPIDHELFIGMLHKFLHNS